ncbi:MAG: D-(-)-3-hydroxybutyrate oligomer hydrolase [Candidatus Competibacteraceae bacterium]|nr:D-(-)-3-hydroxybutyrate oligomer hydrolase [Candidatus Competibacteraceae bacterium]
MIALLGAALPELVAGQDSQAAAQNKPNVKPAFLGAITQRDYDGITDDLLTGGLGWDGLQAAYPAPPTPDPSAAELRRRAIHTNYRAVLDISSAGGYGRLYGPNVALDGAVDPTPGAGKIAGTEYLAYADDGSGRKNVTLMVQIPSRFDLARPCIVTAPSSGSRGVYGAIGASGEWGLKRGCAVAYTDKGTGNGLHDLMDNRVGLIDGTRADAAAAGPASHFTADLSDAERSAFNALYPDRVAYKHAHSQQNPEQAWGRNTLQAIIFAFYVLNERHGSPGPRGGKRVVFDPANTLVIASGISNGGGAALAAAEQDRRGLIDGVAVTEPNVQPADASRVSILYGGGFAPMLGKPLYDYFTYANLYQPCAALSARAAGSPLANLLATPNAAGAANRCAGLRAKGLLATNTLAEQAEESLDKLRAYGWLPDSDLLHASHYRLATNAIVVTYANAYGRFSVADRICGFSFANTDPTTGAVIPQVAAIQDNLFGGGNGVPPTSGVNIVYDEALDGPMLDLLARSPSTGSADFALDGAICHRNLVEGRDIVTGQPLTDEMRAASSRVRRGIRAVQLRGNLRDKPALIVHGRSDTLVPVNHSSRPYYAVAGQGAGGHNLRYIEVANAQHFDAFLSLPGYDIRYVPLHVYLNQALDWMYEHLTAGKPLPPSQVVRTAPRGGTAGSAPELTAANVPPILETPAPADGIRIGPLISLYCGAFASCPLHIPE